MAPTPGALHTHRCLPSRLTPLLKPLWRTHHLGNRSAHLLSADRHKRAADSPAHSPLKALVSKKHMGDDGSLTNQEREDLGSLASIPASEHLLKSIILTLHKNIQAEFRSSVSHVHSRIDHVQERKAGIERQMEEVTHSYNELIYSQPAHAEDIQFLKAKVADLEDRSRQNNIKFRGLPATV